EALTNVDLPYMFGFRDYTLSALFGLSLIGGYFVVGMAVFYWWVLRRPAVGPGAGVPGGGGGVVGEGGAGRVGVTGFLVLAVAGAFIKMVMRHALNIKYILVTPWINI